MRALVERVDEDGHREDGAPAAEPGDEQTDDEEDPEPVKVFTATWVVTDVEASGLVYGSRSHGSGGRWR